MILSGTCLGAPVVAVLIQEAIVVVAAVAEVLAGAGGLYYSTLFSSNWLELLFFINFVILCSKSPKTKSSRRTPVRSRSRSASRSRSGSKPHSLSRYSFLSA